MFNNTHKPELVYSLLCYRRIYVTTDIISYNYDRILSFKKKKV